MFLLTKLRISAPNETGLVHVLGEDEQVLAESIDANFGRRVCLSYNAHEALVKALQNFVNGVETGFITSFADETLANATNKAISALKLAKGEA